MENNIIVATTSNNPNILNMLAQENDIWVHMRVARNPNTLSQTLKLLAESNHWQVRANVARHPNTSQKGNLVLVKCMHIIHMPFHPLYYSIARVFDANHASGPVRPSVYIGIAIGHGPNSAWYCPRDLDANHV